MKANQGRTAVKGIRKKQRMHLSLYEDQVRWLTLMRDVHGVDPSWNVRKAVDALMTQMRKSENVTK